MLVHRIRVQAHLVGTWPERLAGTPVNDLIIYCTVQVKDLGYRHLTRLVDLPRASLELVAQHLLVSLSFRPAAPHQQCCWLVHLPVQALVQ